jgi:hypothetical protein
MRFTYCPSAPALAGAFTAFRRALRRTQAAFMRRIQRSSSGLRWALARCGGGLIAGGDKTGCGDGDPWTV